MRKTSLKIFVLISICMTIAATFTSCVNNDKTYGDVLTVDTNGVAVPHVSVTISSVILDNNYASKQTTLKGTTDNSGKFHNEFKYEAILPVTGAILFVSSVPGIKIVHGFKVITGGDSLIYQNVLINTRDSLIGKNSLRLTLHQTSSVTLTLRRGSYHKVDTVNVK